jgi:hypothetical protein
LSDGYLVHRHQKPDNGQVGKHQRRLVDYGKTEDDGNPVPHEAVGYGIADYRTLRAIQERQLPVRFLSNQHANRKLKQIAKACGIWFYGMYYWIL